MSGVGLIDNAKLDVMLNYKLAHNGSNPNGEYGSLDRFGRVTRHAWTDGGFTTHATDTTVPNIPPIVEMAYGFDRVSNVVSAYDDRPGARLELSHEYTYDDLHRLTEAERGLWDNSDGSGDFTLKKNSQRFTLDVLQNFKSIETDADGTNGYESDETENRLAASYSDANELKGRDTDNDQSDEITIDYDLNGNTTCVDPSPGSGSPIVHYTYDGWNRLVRVEHEKASQLFDIAEYEYNALHQRIIKRSDEDVSEGGLDHLRLMYYSPSWQLLEERIDDNWSESSSTIDRHLQYIYGALYIDDLILRRQDSNVDGDFTDAGDRHWYHLTDPQFSTMAILDSTATVVEEVTYDAFGKARHHQKNDFDGDGDFDATDYGIISTIAGVGGVGIGAATYRSECDLDRDGDVDLTDVSLCGTNYQSAIASGYLSDTWNNSGSDNTHGWSGYYADRETRLYHVRFRYYDTALLRWINRDPAGYQDSMNLYGLGAGNPIWGVDPFGLYLRELGNDELWDIPGIREIGQARHEGAQWAGPLFEAIPGVVIGGGAIGLAAGPMLSSGTGGAGLLAAAKRWLQNEVGRNILPNWLYNKLVKAIGRNATGVQKYQWLRMSGYGRYLIPRVWSPRWWWSFIWLYLSKGPTPAVTALVEFPLILWAIWQYINWWMDETPIEQPDRGTSPRKRQIIDPALSEDWTWSPAMFRTLDYDRCRRWSLQ